MNIEVDCGHLQASHTYKIDVKFVVAEQSMYVLKIHHEIGVSI